MSCPFAKYSDIFGKPNEGVHSKRLLDIAIVDMGATLGIAAIISAITSYYLKENFFKVFIILFIILFLIGIIFHRLFCVDTTINKLIFGEVNKLTKVN
jgi:polyferredoxin